MIKRNEAPETLRVDILYESGCKRRVVIPRSAIAFVKNLAVFRSDLFQGTGFNPLDADICKIVAVTRADHDILHRPDSRRDRATYRLGQMDMREAAAQMLEDLADGTQGTICSTLIDAAQRVRQLNLCEEAGHEDS